MKKILLAALIAVSMTACLPMSDESAMKAVQGMGFTDIKLEGMTFFGCSEDDTFRKKFTAKNQSGQVVSGVVCGGFVKGSTIRLD